ncbi:hypothetical protein [Dulcicalothrix desertica]|uniref:hypothetical protein n=1 Tax=Dulcicalothrix desertica TaxID=32056 RepID=UPI000F8C8A78|nr:hypothetical protein [Dulcicalothrix desertica]TWH61401.1 hypothetical protein CAL7102_00961 [Dulcicalothrix desertica PCC 7102]
MTQKYPKLGKILVRLAIELAVCRLQTNQWFQLPTSHTERVFGKQHTLQISLSDKNAALSQRVALLIFIFVNICVGSREINPTGSVDHLCRPESLALIGLRVNVGVGSVDLCRPM